MRAGWRWAGVVVGVLVGCFALWTGAFGRGALLAAPLFGLSVVFGVLLGELGFRVPASGTRRAGLEVRRVRDYLPQPLGGAVISAWAVLFVLLLVTTATGSAADQGRTLVRRCDAIQSSSAGPWPGAFYTGPLGVLLLVGAVTAGLALRAIVRRPRPADVIDQPADDDILRQRSADAVTGACGVLVTIPLVAVSLIAAGALLDIGCRPFWWTVAGWLLIASVPFSLALLAISTAAILPLRRTLSPAS